MNHKNLKTKVLPQIKFKYSGNKKGPKHPDLVCYYCGKENIRPGSMVKPTRADDIPKIICEECTIEEFKEEHGYKTKKAAAARRRRIFDVGYLFTEIFVDKYCEKKSISSPDSLDARIFQDLLTLSSHAYSDFVSKEKKEELEEIEDQKE